jgi:hypothetical protein
MPVNSFFQSRVLGHFIFQVPFFIYFQFNLSFEILVLVFTAIKYKVFGQNIQNGEINSCIVYQLILNHFTDILFTNFIDKNE